MLRARKSKGARSDRLTRLLVALAAVLTIVLVAIIIDIRLRPATDSSGEQALRFIESSPSAETLVLAPSATPTHGTPPPCIAPHDWGVHIVHQADTLYSLSNRYGTDVSTLQRVNCLKDSTILVNQRLYVPGPAALPTLATPTSIAEGTFPTAVPQSGKPVALAAELPAEEYHFDVPALDPAVQGRTTSRINIPDRYLHIVLLGSDMRPDERIGGIKGRPNQATWRTDAIIVVSLDFEDSSVRLLHIPRDLWVEIPGHDEGRINTAELFGELAETGSGPNLVKQVIHHNLGIPIHYYARADFEGFMNVIDTLGGLEFAVDCPLPEFDLEPGIHHFDGYEALQYVKKRETASDLDRGRRQRQMLTALWDQLLTPEIIPKIPQLWATTADSFQTDLPLDQAINLASFGLQLKAQNIRQAGLTHKQVKSWTSPGGQMVLRAREDEIRAFLEQFYAPLAKTAKVDKVRIQVLNGSDRSQAEELAAATLRGKGFKVVDKGQADRKDYATTQIRVLKGDPAAGEWVAERLNIAPSAIHDLTETPDPPDLSNAVDIKVVLGADYDPCQR
jgi:LCP family protein required for cell wall assembly